MYFFFLMIRPPPRSTRTDTLFPYTTLFRSAQLGGVEGIAFDKLELAADHPVERAHVALDIDALDEDLGAFLDVVDDVDGQVVAVALDARADVDEGIAKIADGVGERLDGLVDLAGVVPVAFLGGAMLAQGLRIEIAQAGLQADLAALVARSRSEEHTAELPSIMRPSYALFFLKNTNQNK